MVKISRILVMMVSSMVMTVVESSRSVDVDGDDSEILRRHLLANGLGLTPPMGSMIARLKLLVTTSVRGDMHPALWGSPVGNSRRTTNDIKVPGLV
ncbi:PREDICTED: alpha-galactosidase 1-like isoform X2 [Camelina sativa]|uniref:Alpha-galactosidase 1-like isoform X2 n=1 Tax=Camelina sativa TaxID=90675 RepID=A0ABM1QU23_CAMSA|nr:PREDICTED: alpha-galactosidase 1-like isoform X2 [Camelina sativa]